MEAGALGFTTSRSQAHRTGDKRPVASRKASWEEVVRLVHVLGKVGTGIFQSAFEIPGETDNEEQRREYTERMVNLARDSGVTCTLGISSGRRGFPSRTPEMIDAINNGGGRAFAMTRCRGINLILGFKTHISFDVHPEWQRVLALPHEAKMAAFKDPETRARMIHEAHHGHFDFEKRMNAEPRRANYDFIYILDRAVPPYTTVAQAAKARGVDPVELMIDLAVETEFNQLFYQPLDNDDPESLVKVMKHPTGVMTFSDSGAHVTRIMDSSIQTHLLAYFVRERHDFTHEEGVKMLTSIPAQAWDIPERGVLREGYFADINIFDPQTIAPLVPTVETDLPAKAKRLVQKAQGFKATIVGGQELLCDGQPTGAVPGRLLLNRLARQS
jgi:N-acyl-D-aspartate/D-glutamate deacylase